MKKIVQMQSLVTDLSVLRFTNKLGETLLNSFYTIIFIYVTNSVKPKVKVQRGKKTQVCLI